MFAPGRSPTKVSRSGPSLTRVRAILAGPAMSSSRAVRISASRLTPSTSPLRSRSTGVMRFSFPESTPGEGLRRNLGRTDHQDGNLGCTHDLVRDAAQSRAPNPPLAPSGDRHQPDPAVPSHLQDRPSRLGPEHDPAACSQAFPVEPLGDGLEILFSLAPDQLHGLLVEAD